MSTPRRPRLAVTRLLGSTLAAALVLVATIRPAPAAQPELKTDEQKTLYALGIAIARNLGSFGLTEAELEFVKAGLTDGVLQRELRVDLQTFGPKIQELQQTRG